jgi:tRNA A64-2'-O-ribosylphosphate transferase
VPRGGFLRAPFVCSHLDGSFVLIDNHSSRESTGSTRMGDSGSPPVSVSSLYFPSAAQSFSQTLSLLRRSALSVTNRLKSIEADAIFVESVADHYGLPLVANERCGAWYIQPEKKAGSAYFKSTDGHAGQWDFSFRRLNLQMLSTAREHGG